MGEAHIPQLNKKTIAGRPRKKLRVVGLPKLRFNKNLLYFVFVPLILASKLIRYSASMSSLIENASESYILNYITSPTFTFSLRGIFLDTDAFVFTAWLFRWMRHFGFTTYIPYEVAFTVVYNLILLIIIKTSMPRSLSFFQLVFVLMNIAVLNIFDFTLSKDIVQFLFFLAIYWVLRSGKLSIRGKYVYSCLILLLCGLLFRMYYFLSIGFFFLCLALNTLLKKSNWVLYWLAAGLAYFTILLLLNRFSTGLYIDLISVRTRVSDAHTNIRNWFTVGSGAVQIPALTSDYLLIILRLLFPFELLAMGPKYLPYVLLQVMVTFSFLYTFSQLGQIAGEHKLALLLFLGFVFASAVFEPDFGSWIRHEAAAFPLILFVSNISSTKQRRPTKYARNIHHRPRV